MVNSGTKISAMHDLPKGAISVALHPTYAQGHGTKSGIGVWDDMLEGGGESKAISSS